MKSPVATPVLLAICLQASLAVAGTARLDSGGTGGQFGSLYGPDRLYTTANGAGAIGGTAVTPLLATNGQLIENTSYTSLFNSVREGVTEYRFDVPNGTYLLTMQFVELLENGPNLRRFSVLAEGVPLLTDLDLYALYGRNYAVTYQFAVNVSDGQLNVTFPATIGQSTISGIAVQRIARDLKAPAMPTDVAALGGYYRNIVTWPDQTEPDLAGYLVRRSSTPTGPFTLLTPTPTPVSRYFDDAVTPFAADYYQIAAVDVFGNQSAFTSAVGAAPLDRTQSILPVYQLSIPPDQYAILQANPDSDYVTATFIGDSTTFADIGVKYRGSSSLDNEKKSWKVNFKKGVPFEGRDKLNQKAVSTDTTLLTECLSSAQLQAVSTLATSCSFSHLEVNGEFMGVFSRIEEVDDDFFNARGINPSGQLLEAQNPAYANLRILPDYSVGWDDHSDNDDGYPALSALVQTINTTPDAKFASTIASVVNVDAYLDYVAAMAVDGDWDHISHNYYMYKSPDSPLWEVIPKDFDQAFVQSSLSLLQAAKTSPGQPITSYNVLTSRLLTVPLYRQWYVNKLSYLLGSSFTPPVLMPRIDGFHSTVADDAHRDVYKRGREDNSGFDQSAPALQDFVTARIAYIDANLASIAPNVAQPLLINEIVPDNRTGIADRAGAHSPWLELYNPGSTPYRLTGHTLTNDPSQPGMWKFPNGTTVPAGGYLLVWLDNAPAAGELHASFGVNPKGQAVALYAPISAGGALLDTIAYRAIAPDVSYARRSDGAALWSVQTSPSPLGPNTGP
ncbi:MAG: CotH kinase family protein [Proteobacteria bacterium]|nr:CotH kinase family protein [Pseudomonadota bacterium]